MEDKREYFMDVYAIKPGDMDFGVVKRRIGSGGLRFDLYRCRGRGAPEKLAECSCVDEARIESALRGVEFIPRYEFESRVFRQPDGGVTYRALIPKRHPKFKLEISR